MEKIDVLIVGAGPTGLMMAYLLAKQNISVRLIDKNAAPTDKSKALAVQSRTLEIFDYLGIVEPFLEQGLKIKSANPFSKKTQLAHISFESLKSPFNFVLSLEQSKTEKILSDFVKLKNIDIERELELLDFSETSDEVNATIRNNKTKNTETVCAKWMIGCDGAHSLIRKKLDLSFLGKTFSDVFSLADIHLDWNKPHDELFFFLESEGVMGAIPMKEDNRYRLIFQLPRCRNLLKNSSHTAIFDESEIADPSLSEVQEIIDKVAGGDAKVRDPIWMANFHINSRLTKNYQIGRIFLVGDAAHIHSPVGGQGMNTGLQDAFNLSWKLSQDINQNPESPFLKSYELERQYVGKKLLESTENASHIATLKNSLLIKLRNFLAKKLFKSEQFQRKITSAISQLGLSYPKSIITDDRGGKRAPMLY